MTTATRSNNCHQRQKSRRQAFPFFGNILNEVMQTPVGNVIANKHIQYTTPLVNVKELEDGFQIYLTLPGYEKTDVKISLDKNVLILSSDKEHNAKKKFRLREFNYGKFERRFNLPESADKSKIDASFNNGILQINIAKKTKEALQAKKIEIQ